jgi:glutamate-1-semialdehyde 2,1-aminomutase
MTNIDPQSLRAGGPWPVRHEQSLRCFERARAVLPGGVVGQGRTADPHPLYMTRASGARIWDVDGNEYVDFHCGFASVLHGHNDPRLQETIARTLEQHGVSYSAAHPAEAELAERIVRHVPSAERVALACTGSEMTFHSLRLARSHTGRQLIVKFEGNYHGWHDPTAWSVHFNPDDAGPGSAPVPVRESSGMQAGVERTILICEYNDAERLAELFAEHGDEIAAVIVEPIFHNGGVITPVAGFLEACRELCTAHGALLIFDEIITGFRQALGGAQAVFGVTPDLTTLGKAVANGFPISVLAGRAEIMDGLAPIGPTFYSGTFNGHTLNVAVANRSVELLEEDPPYERLNELGTALRTGIEAAIAESGASAQVQQFGSVWSVYFTTDPIHTYRDIARFSQNKDHPANVAYQRFLLTRGFYVHPHYMIRGYLTSAHRREDIDALVEATREFLMHQGAELSALSSAG